MKDSIFKFKIKSVSYNTNFYKLCGNYINDSYNVPLPYGKLAQWDYRNSRRVTTVISVNRQREERKVKGNPHQLAILACSYTRIHCFLLLAQASYVYLFYLPSH